MTDQLDALLDTLSNAITEAIADLPHTWLGDKEQADHVMAVEAGDAAFAAVERVLTATPQSEGRQLRWNEPHPLASMWAAGDSRPSEGLRDDDIVNVREVLDSQLQLGHPMTLVPTDVLSRLLAALSAPTLDAAIIPAALRATFPKRYAESGSFTLDLDDARTFIAEYASLHERTEP